MIGELIFEIVNQMTPSEKIYLSSLAKSSGKKKLPIYYELYQIIDKMKVYDEAELKRKFSHNQLSYHKNYLYNTLLNVLNQNSFEVTLNDEIIHLISSIRNLLRKKLYSNAKYVLNKATKKIIENEKYIHQNFQIEIHFLQLAAEHHLPRHSDFKLQQDYIEQINGRLITLMQYQEEYRDLQYTESYYWLANRKGLIDVNSKDPITQKTLDLIRNVVDRPLKSNHFENKNIYLGICGTYSNYIDKKASNRDYYKERLDLFNEFQLFKNENPKDYIALISNQLQTLLLSGKLEEREFYLKELESNFFMNETISIDSELTFEALRVYVLNQLIFSCLHINHQNLSLDNKLSVVTKYWKKYRKDFALLGYTYYFFIIYCFNRRQYDSCIVNTKAFLKYETNSQRKRFILLIRVLALFENGDLDTAWALSRSFKRHQKNLMKRSNLVLFELVELYINRKTTEDWKEAFLDKKNDIISISSPIIRKSIHRFLLNK